MSNYAWDLVYSQTRLGPSVNPSLSHSLSLKIGGFISTIGKPECIYRLCLNRKTGMITTHCHDEIQSTLRNYRVWWFLFIRYPFVLRG